MYPELFYIDGLYRSHMRRNSGLYMKAVQAVKTLKQAVVLGKVT